MKTRRPGVGAIVALASLLAAAACGGGRYVRTADRPFPVAADEVGIELVNENYWEARVYAKYEGGGRYALGSVGPSGGVETGLSIPWTPSYLCFELDLVTGPGRYRSEPLLVRRGETLQLRIPANIDHSGFFARAACP